MLVYSLCGIGVASRLSRGMYWSTFVEFERSVIVDFVGAGFNLFVLSHQMLLLVLMILLMVLLILLLIVIETTVDTAVFVAGFVVITVNC